VAFVTGASHPRNKSVYSVHYLPAIDTQRRNTSQQDMMVMVMMIFTDSMHLVIVSYEDDRRKLDDDDDDYDDYDDSPDRRDADEANFRAVYSSEMSSGTLSSSSSLINPSPSDRSRRL